MAISVNLSERCGGICELCNNLPAVHEYTVSPRADDLIENQVALCDTCLSAMDEKDKGNYWRCLEGSIWNPEPGIQALSYRLLQIYKDEDWANDAINSVELDENIIQWAMSAFEVADFHKDAFGNLLDNGDTVVLTQGLKVKGTSFTAAKGTVVKKIRLVSDNTDHIEGKINEQTIVILTKFVKKG
ncbi:MAG TPA: PhnA domain-containing protein [Chitinophagaceae bacterium]|nr:PhnA domain-containing protein [Chitinophagaceae bacterium]